MAKKLKQLTESETTHLNELEKGLAVAFGPKQAGQITIDPEFSHLCPPLSPEEKELLEASIAIEGCRDPLIVWRENDILLDGHHRIAICQRLEKSFKVIGLPFRTRDDAKEWVIQNQRGRRNLTPEQRDELIARLYEMRKGKHGDKSRFSAKPQNEALIARGKTHAKKTADVIAEEFGVSRATVERAVAANRPDSERRTAQKSPPPKPAAKRVAIDADVEEMIEALTAMIDKVKRLASRNYELSKDGPSRTVVSTLQQAIGQLKAMDKSWSNKK